MACAGGVINIITARRRPNRSIHCLANENGYCLLVPSASTSTTPLAQVGRAGASNGTGMAWNSELWLSYRCRCFGVVVTRHLWPFWVKIGACLTHPPATMLRIVIQKCSTTMMLHFVRCL